MDPSYNDSFGQSASGTSNPSGATVGVGGVPGANAYSAGVPSMSVSSPISTSQDDIILSPSSSVKKRFNGKIAAIVGVVVAAVVAIAAIVMVSISNQGSTEEEIYSALWEFYNEASYKELVEIYSYSFGASVENKDQLVVFSNLNKGSIDFTNQRLESLRIAYEKLKKLNPGQLPKEQKENFNSIVKNIDKVLDAIQENIDSVAGFYSDFIDPLMTLYSEEKIMSCKKTEDVQTLISSYKNEDLAEKYFSVFCGAVEFYDSNGDEDVLPENIVVLLQNFASAFDDVLIDIDDYYDDEIKMLIDYFEASNEEN